MPSNPASLLGIAHGDTASSTMRSNIIVLVALFVLVTAKRSAFMRDGSVYPTRKSIDTTRVPTTGRSHVSQVVSRSNVGDAVVENFVDTLMASERYLKMIETVELKLTHLDMTFHERTNSILKYLSEMLRTIKASSSELLEKALKNVKTDLDTLKQSLSERVDGHPKLRGECYYLLLFRYYITLALSLLYRLARQI